MDPITSLMNTFSHDSMGEFHPACLDTFCGQSSPYPIGPFGHRSSVSNPGQMEFNQPGYSQVASQQYGHSISQSFQPSLSDRQMTSAFMCQTQPQPHSDNFYPFQAQTPPFFPQKHQAGPHQLLQSPTSPSINITMYQSPSPQFASMTACPQNSQISPRHHQTPQVPLLCSQKNQQISSLQNQQHQQAAHLNGNNQPQRFDQCSKLVASKQTNSPKDRINDQFYSSQCPQITDSSLSSFSNMMQPTSPAHIFQTGGVNSGNAVHNDSWSRSLHGGKLGSSGNTHSINQATKPNAYSHQNCFDQPTSTAPTSLQQNRYGKSESIAAGSQRIQKASPASSGSSYRPQVASNQSFFTDHNTLSAFSDAANHSIRSVHSKAPGLYDPLAGEMPSAQNMHYKPTPHISRENKKVSNQGKTSSRAGRPAISDSFLENHYGESSHLQRMNNMNSAALFATAVDSSESARSVGRGRDTAIKGGSKTNGSGKTVHKSMSDSLSPIHWYKCPGTTGASSFQSDIEAMQADVASYVSTSAVQRTSNKSSPVTHGALAQRPTEPTASSKNGHKQTPQSQNIHKSSSFSRTEGQSSDTSKAESSITSKVSRAEALAAIQIKQELVDNMTKYKTVISSSGAETTSTKTTPATQPANKVSNTSVSQSNREGNNFINRPSTVKDTGGNTHPKQQQPDTSARRHSSADYDPKTIELMQRTGPSANMSQYMPTMGRTSAIVGKTIADNYPGPRIVDNMSGGHQAHIQNRRHTAAYLPDRTSSIGRYETACSPDQWQYVDAQRSPALRQTKGNLDFPSQSIIHHLFDQVQSLEMQYSSGQKHNMMPANKAVQRESVGSVDRNGQIHSGFYERSALPPCENMFDKWPAEQASGSIPGTGHIVAPINKKNSIKSSDHANINTKHTSLQVTRNENLEQVPNPVFHNNTSRDAHIHKIIKMENSNESSKPVSVVCYVILHGHKLVCLKSSVEALLLLCQFQIVCFPDRSTGTIDTCIDNILQISRKVLKHQDKERIVLYLKRSGYHLGGMVQTICLEDAKRVYHHLYGITCCTDSACVVEMFHTTVDLDSVYTSNAKPITREPKKEKMSADDNNYGQLISQNNSGTSSSVITGKESSKKMTEMTKQIRDKFLNSHTTALPQRGFGNSENDYSAAGAKDVVCNESDDLIIMETPEEPNMLRWTGNGLKIGGLCNTIVGQLRSYMHENERFLVVDDLCRVFGSADFYDGVERENIILYSCCSEIASFLNSISGSFSPLQSLHDSLVKQKDIGIHVTDTNSASAAGTTDRSILGSSFLKRPLCKQEIVDDDDEDDDDDCTSPKQFRFEDFAQVSESANQKPTQQRPLAINQAECIDEAVVDRDSTDHEPQHSVSQAGRIEQANNKTSSVYSEISISAEEQSTPLTVYKSPCPSGQESNTQIVESSVSLEAASEGPIIKTLVANTEVATHSTDKNSMPSIVIESSNPTCEDNSVRKSVVSLNSVQSLRDVCLKVTRQFAHKIHPSQPPSTVDCDLLSNAGGSSKLLNVTEAGNVFPNPSSPVSSRSTASLGEPSPLLIDLNNSIKEPSADGEKLEQNSVKSNSPDLASSTGQQHFDSLTDKTQASSCTLSMNISEQQPPISEGTNMNHENNHLETELCQQSDKGGNIPLTNGSVDDPLQDCISAQQTTNQDKVISRPTSSILRSRVEKLKKALETRKSKDLPLPTLFLENCLNLDILIKSGFNSKNKNDFVDTSKSETVAKKTSNVDHNTVDVKSHTKRSIVKSNVSCASNVIKTEICSKKWKRSDLFHLDGHKVAIKDGSQEAMSDLIEPLEHPTEKSVQEITTDNVSAIDKSTEQTPLSFLSVSRYFHDNSRAVDDTDAVVLTTTNMSGVRGAFAKLWQDHRELLGTVDALKKRLDYEKAEKERCEKISKYYEGVIHDITSTFKNGDEVTPTTASDDCETMESDAEDSFWKSLTDSSHTFQTLTCLSANSFFVNKSKCSHGQFQQIRRQLIVWALCSNSSLS